MTNFIFNLFFPKVKNNQVVGTGNDATRQKWVVETLAKIPPGLRLLDAGAGECRYRPNCAHLDYVSQDFNQYEGTGDKIGLQTNKWDTSSIDIVSDIINIPVEKNSFDVVLCTEVLEHIPDPVAALREFTRILKPHGELIVTAPFCSLTHFSPYHFATGFNANFYKHWMKTLDFNIIELTPNGNYFDYMAQEVRRLRSVAKTYTGTEGPQSLQRIRQLMIDHLGDLAQKDKGSSELLCFGYHLHAKKNP